MGLVAIRAPALARVQFALRVAVVAIKVCAYMGRVAIAASAYTRILFALRIALIAISVAAVAATHNGRNAITASAFANG